MSTDKGGRLEPPSQRGGCTLANAAESDRKKARRACWSGSRKSSGRLAPGRGSGVRPWWALVITEAKIRAGPSPPVIRPMDASSSFPSHTPQTYRVE